MKATDFLVVKEAQEQAKADMAFYNKMNENKMKSSNEAQEPVAYMVSGGKKNGRILYPHEYEFELVVPKVMCVPLYLNPADQPIGLTDKEIDDLISNTGGLIDSLNDPWDCNVGDHDETRSIKKDLRKFARVYEEALWKKNANIRQIHT